MRDEVLERAVESLVAQGCHSVILYGSRARGDWSDDSDYDLIGFRAEGGKIRDARVLDGKYIDAFVYPVADVQGSEKDYLRIRGGKVVREKEGFATGLLAKVDVLFAQGPEPVPEDELEAIRVWVGKMLKRIDRGDIEGNYRRVSLQYQLLEDYFALRRQWYLGPKESFRQLAAKDPAVRELFERALKPGSSVDDLRALAARVLAG